MHFIFGASMQCNRTVSSVALLRVQALNVAAAVFVGLLMVETKQHSLAQIQANLLLPDTHTA